MEIEDYMYWRRGRRVEQLTAHSLLVRKDAFLTNLNSPICHSLLFLHHHT